MANTKVQSEQIEDGAITAAKIADGAIVASEVADNAITTAKINADAVTGAKIADNAIDSEHYTDGSIDTAHIADANITTAKIADDAVTSAKIDTNIDIAGTFDVTGATTLDSTVKAAGTVLSTAAAQVNSTSAGGFGFASNNTAFYSFGADTSTAGSYTFQNLSSNASVNITAMKIAADGKVGIGTTSPNYSLDVGTIGHNSTGEILLTGGNSASNDYTQTALLRLRATSINPNRTTHDDNASVAEIRLNHGDKSGNNSDGFISFYTNPSNYNTAVQERIRIDSSGRVNIGHTSSSANGSAAVLSVGNTSGGTLSLIDSDDAPTNGGLSQIYGGNQRMYFYTGGSGASSYMQFYTNDSERMRILSGGGITFNGDTAAANALDDYEEGTWTPELNFGGSATGISYSARLGIYTKIGDTVTIWGNCILTNKGSASGNVTITGLPFTPTSGTGNHKFGAFAIAANMASMPQTNTWVMPHSNAYLYIRYQGSTTEGDLNDSNFTNTSNFGWTVTYKTNA